MENEVSGMAMLGIVLAMLAAAIGVGFGIFTITSKSMNNNVTLVEEQAQKTFASDFKQYDNALFTGSGVLDAIYSNLDERIAICVCTQQFTDDTYKVWRNGGDIDTVASGVYGAYTNQGNELPYFPIYNAIDAAESGYGTDNVGIDNTVTALTSTNEEAPVYLINYNYLLGSLSMESSGTVNNGYTIHDRKIYAPAMYMNSGRLYCLSDILLNEVDREVRNDTFINFNKSVSHEDPHDIGRDRSEYIDPTMTFRSHLILNKLGDLVGIAFIHSADTSN